MSDMVRIRDQLESELQDVLSKHSRLSAHLRNEDREVPADWSEMAQFVENDEVLEALEVRARARVDALTHAVRRIEAGTYGLCLSCGGSIDRERLELLPTTSVCVVCA
jgi:RNA polymerase-binding transcription factor DksA